MVDGVTDFFCSPDAICDSEVYPGLALLSTLPEVLECSIHYLPESHISVRMNLAGDISYIARLRQPNVGNFRGDPKKLENASALRQLIVNDLIFSVADRKQPLIQTFCEKYGIKRGEITVAVESGNEHIAQLPKELRTADPQHDVVRSLLLSNHPQFQGKENSAHFPSNSARLFTLPVGPMTLHGLVHELAELAGAEERSAFIAQVQPQAAEMWKMYEISGESLIRHGALDPTMHYSQVIDTMLTIAFKGSDDPEISGHAKQFAKKYTQYDIAMKQARILSEATANVKAEDLLRTFFAKSPRATHISNDLHTRSEINNWVYEQQLHKLLQKVETSLFFDDELTECLSSAKTFLAGRPHTISHDTLAGIYSAYQRFGLSTY